jgi:hypothetical protein
LAEYLYAIVASISYIDITTAIDGDTVGGIELTVPRTEATESGLEDTTRVEYLYAIVDRISYIDITTAIDRDTVGVIELTVPRTLATESELEDTTRVEYLYATVASSNSHFETILRCFSDLEIR